jgi:alpha/beta hydrolase fold
MSLTFEPVSHRRIAIDGGELFYRETGSRQDPTLLLLHGFPSASHQFRRLIDALSSRFHVVAPDYPGFGHSESPTPASAGGSFVHSFDRLSEIVELPRAPRAEALLRVRLRLRCASRPEDRHLPPGVVRQSDLPERQRLRRRAEPTGHPPPGETPEQAVERHRQILILEATRSQYETGATNPERIDPDSWTLDQRVLDLPGRDRVMLDYGTYIEL